MPNLKWTYNKLNFIKLNLHLTDKVLGEYFNVTAAAVKTIRQKHSLYRGNYNYWTKQEDEYLIKNYPNNRTDKVAKHLNKTTSSTYQHANLLGLRKSKEFLASPESGVFIKGSTIGHQYRYTKGNVPANKGKKMSNEIREKVKHTFFQKGHQPANTLQDGAITIRHDKTPKSKRAYKYIRISEGNWVELHRLNWENKYGQVPKGFNIVFKNGDSMNCDLSNLEIISNADLLKRNSLHQWPPELQEVIRINNKLKKQING